MQSDKLKLFTVSIEVLLASIFILIGSTLLHAALYGLLFPHGTTQLIPSVVTWGAVLIIMGMPIAWDAGRRLKGKHLVIIAVADMLAAFVLILLIFPPAPHLVPGWLAIVGINNALLDIALLTGHLKEQSARAGSEAILTSPR